MNFNALMDAWMARPVIGLSLRVIFLCQWHRITGSILVAGCITLMVGHGLKCRWLEIVGMGVAVPPMICFGLLFCSMPVLLILEKLFPQDEKEEGQ